jgi:RNA polymerase-interacting CarD/CdnL/TRCF family regulator
LVVVVAAAAASAASRLRVHFSIGDLVVHPYHGVGRVTKLEQKQFSQARQLYYEIAISHGTLWVAVETQEGLRSMTPRADLPRYRTMLMSSPKTLDKDYHLRRLALRGLLESGTFEAKCEVVRDLTAHGWPKPLSDVDSSLLRQAKDSLCQEWAAADEVTVAEANHEIAGLLREARRIHHK